MTISFRRSHTLLLMALLGARLPANTFGAEGAVQVNQHGLVIASVHIAATGQNEPARNTLPLWKVTTEEAPPFMDSPSDLSGSITEKSVPPLEWMPAGSSGQRVGRSTVSFLVPFEQAPSSNGDEWSLYASRTIIVALWQINSDSSSFQVCRRLATLPRVANSLRGLNPVAKVLLHGTYDETSNYTLPVSKQNQESASTQNYWTIACCFAVSTFWLLLSGRKRRERPDQQDEQEFNVARPRDRREQGFWQDAAVATAKHRCPRDCGSNDSESSRYEEEFLSQEEDEDDESSSEEETVSTNSARSQRSSELEAGYCTAQQDGEVESCNRGKETSSLTADPGSEDFDRWSMNDELGGSAFEREAGTDLVDIGLGGMPSAGKLQFFSAVGPQDNDEHCCQSVFDPLIFKGEKWRREQKVDQRLGGEAQGDSSCSPEKHNTEFFCRHQTSNQDAIAISNVLRRAESSGSALGKHVVQSMPDNIPHHDTTEQNILGRNEHTNCSPWQTSENVVYKNASLLSPNAEDAVPNLAQARFPHDTGSDPSFVVCDEHVGVSFAQESQSTLLEIAEEEQGESKPAMNNSDDPPSTLVQATADDGNDDKYSSQIISSETEKVSTSFTGGLGPAPQETDTEFGQEKTDVPSDLNESLSVSNSDDQLQLDCSNVHHRPLDVSDLHSACGGESHESIATHIADDFGQGGLRAAGTTDGLQPDATTTSVDCVSPSRQALTMELPAMNNHKSNDVAETAPAPNELAARTGLCSELWMHANVEPQRSPPPNETQVWSTNPLATVKNPKESYSPEKNPASEDEKPSMNWDQPRNLETGQSSCSPGKEIAGQYRQPHRSSGEERATDSGCESKIAALLHPSAENSSHDSPYATVMNPPEHNQRSDKDNATEEVTPSQVPGEPCKADIRQSRSLPQIAEVTARKNRDQMSSGAYGGASSPAVESNLGSLRNPDKNKSSSQDSPSDSVIPSVDLGYSRECDDQKTTTEVVRPCLTELNKGTRLVRCLQLNQEAVTPYTRDTGSGVSSPVAASNLGSPQHLDRNQSSSQDSLSDSAIPSVDLGNSKERVDQKTTTVTRPSLTGPEANECTRLATCLQLGKEAAVQSPRGMGVSVSTPVGEPRIVSLQQPQEKLSSIQDQFSVVADQPVGLVPCTGRFEKDSASECERPSLLGDEASSKDGGKSRCLPADEEATAQNSSDCLFREGDSSATTCIAEAKLACVQEAHTDSEDIRNASILIDTSSGEAGERTMVTLDTASCADTSNLQRVNQLPEVSALDCSATLDPDSNDHGSCRPYSHKYAKKIGTLDPQACSSESIDSMPPFSKLGPSFGNDSKGESVKVLQEQANAVACDDHLQASDETEFLQQKHSSSNLETLCLHTENPTYLCDIPTEPRESKVSNKDSEGFKIDGSTVENSVAESKNGSIGDLVDSLACDQATPCENTEKKEGVPVNLSRDEKARHDTSELKGCSSAAEESYVSTLPPASDYRSEDDADRFAFLSTEDNSAPHSRSSLQNLNQTILPSKLRGRRESKCGETTRLASLSNKDNSSPDAESRAKRVPVRRSARLLNAKKTPSQREPKKLPSKIEATSAHAPSGSSSRKRSYAALNKKDSNSDSDSEVLLIGFGSDSEVLVVGVEPPPAKKKTRPFRNSSIVPDWVPSRRLQSVAQRMEDRHWDFVPDSQPSSQNALTPPKSIFLPGRS